MKKSTARLALDLAHTGITLHHCNARGLWQPLKTVALTAPDFELAIARLRKETAENFGAGFKTEILLPENQVIFRALKVEASEGEARRTEICNALAAISRIEAEDLCMCEGITDANGYTHVAAVPTKVWSEALAFSRKWGFNGQIVTTRLPAEGFKMPPVFDVPRAARSGATKKLPTILAAAFAMALVLPVALQISPQQTVPGEIRAFHAELVDPSTITTPEPQAKAPEIVIAAAPVLEPGPQISDAPEMGAITKVPATPGIRVPAISPNRPRDLSFDFASNELEILEDENGVLGQKIETAPSVWSDGPQQNLLELSEALNIALPKAANAVIPSLQAAALDQSDLAPEVVDQHAQTWVVVLPKQPAFRRSGPEFKRPDLNALRRSPGVLRLRQKTHFGPDKIPGTTVISSGAQPNFLERTLNIIPFDELNDQAYLNLNRRTVFKIGAERVVANIGDDVLLSRPQRRAVSDATAPQEVERPKRRAQPVVIEPLLPPDDDLETQEAAETEAVQNSDEVAVSILEGNLRAPENEGVAVVGVPSQEDPIARSGPSEAVFSSAPEANPRLSAGSDAPTEPEIPRPSRRELAAAPEADDATAALEPGVIFPRPQRRQASLQAAVALIAKRAEGAVPVTLAPKPRPSGIKTRAAKIKAARKEVAAAVAATQKQRASVPASNVRLPSSASVKKAATIRNGINRNAISLLGVSGTSSKRKALIRLRRGKVISVERGGRVDGWRVAAIGEESVRLQKGNRSQVLRLPN